MATTLDPEISGVTSAASSTTQTTRTITALMSSILQDSDQIVLCDPDGSTIGFDMANGRVDGHMLTFIQISSGTVSFSWGAYQDPNYPNPNMGVQGTIRQFVWSDETQYWCNVNRNDP